jgi:hypothetical protein
VKKVTVFYPCPDVYTAGAQVVSHAGTMLLTETITRVGLDRSLSAALGRWRPRLAVHDPAKCCWTKGADLRKQTLRRSRR